MTVKTKREGPCNGIALYGAQQGRIEFEKWIGITVKWFDNCGNPVDTIAVDGEGFAGNPIQLDRGMKLLERRGYDKVRRIDLFSTIPDYKQIVFGWRMYASMQVAPQQAVVCFSNNIVSFNVDLLQSLGSELLGCCNCCYGYCYQRDFRLGPDLYASGMTSGLGYANSEMREADAIAKWFHELHEERRFLKGFLRDIYSLNLLSQHHLNMKVIGGEVLADWISRAPIRGKLTLATSDLWWWTLCSTELTQVRALLETSGILLGV